ncbi:hypothetical protein Slin15195_G002450 [Septoria linicola]|uniref:Uncharacterized protein n=1 Tax=Septoria linicola TaxID=215465 RepID=A0A9Q9AJ86_9PEZI|nr:hypothetical protein Slin14017_G002470 [Septoria linicola]USW46926.1 hypothetical protein Slin15195_G002450 [Septoria linicola]
MAGKKDDIEPHRAEIQELTQNGENCEQIAAALRAKGVEISAKSISRYRISWGIRKRAEPKTKGRTYPNRKRTSTEPTKHEQQSTRKAEIIARSERGETAEQIAAAFQAKDIALSSSTVTRLMTFWGLIPYDKARARGRHSEAQKTKRAEREAAPKARKPRQPKQIAAPSDPSEVQHYPSECAFGPQKRTTTTYPVLENPFNLDPAFDAGADSAPHIDGDDHESSAYPAQHARPTMDVAAELMSAEMLVDLATSTLAAANRVKELYIARQAGRSLPGSMEVPSDDDIAAAKQKVREAAAVMHDLAIPNVT